jgi:hypothetical protein
LQLTDALSAAHTLVPHFPHALIGAAESTPQPPHAFDPGSLHASDALSALHTNLN